jgi:large conductance mechanosensitive channel
VTRSAERAELANAGRRSADRIRAVGLMREFKAFLVRGNVVDLAVAFVMGAAFTAVVSGLVKDLITPLIAAIFGKPDFSSLFFTINHSQFLYGDFIDALITFVSVATVVFFFVVKPINAMAAARARGQAPPDPTTKQCTECLSEIPLAATRCAFCAQEQPAAA